jgi:threonine dehydratase
MCQRVAKFSAFMDGAGCLRRIVAGNASWEGELLEQLPQAVFVLLNAGGICLA